MDPEQMLDEAHRPTYRAFLRMGMTPTAAFEATVGRDGASTASPHLDVDDLAESFERLGMSRSGAETAAAGRRFVSFEEARRTEAREAVRRLEEAKPKPVAKPAPKAKPKEKPPATTDLHQLVEAAVAKALAEGGAGTTRTQLSEQARRLVAADIADIEAGRRPSDRLRRT